MGQFRLHLAKARRLRVKSRRIAKHGMRTLSFISTLIVAILWNQVAWPVGLQKLPVQATSSRLARQDARRNIPLNKLSGESLRRIKYVVANPSLFRRITTKSIPCDPDLFFFLTRHPEVLVNIWDLMGITSMQVACLGEHEFHVDDGQGTVSVVELLYGTPQLHILYADGVYEGPLFGRKIYAKCVFIFKTDYKRDATGRHRVVSRLDMFARVENIGADILTRTMRPVAARMADYNFSETTQFVGRLSQAAEENGPGMQRLAQRLSDVDPAVRRKFTELTAAISDRAALNMSENVRGDSTFRSRISSEGQAATLYIGKAPASRPRQLLRLRP